MKAYIKSTSAISPQNTFDQTAYINEWVLHEGYYLNAQEPAYKALINARLLRRMSRIIKMGVAAAKGALQQAEIEHPQAIIVGTGLGCIDDTQKFLDDIINSEEGVLSPTAFIQSTHNTVAGQIALLLQCQSYNYTYTNRGHSFENALVDGLMLLKEGKDHVLVGAAEEATPVAYDAMQKIGCVGNNQEAEDVVLGEGASFFVLSNDGGSDQPFVKDVKIESYLTSDDVETSLKIFLGSNHLRPEDIDALVLGETGSDKYYQKVKDSFNSETPAVAFKRISGEHFTASGLGMHLAVLMLEKQQIFQNTMVSGSFKKPLKNVLIYNHYKKVNHTMMLLSIA